MLIFMMIQQDQERQKKIKQQQAIQKIYYNRDYRRENKKTETSCWIVM